MIKTLRGYLSVVANIMRVNISRFRFYRIKNRIKHKVSNGGKIRVVFVFDDPSKWKCQSLYEKMCASALFEPMIVISYRKVFVDEGLDALKRRMSANEAFMKGLGNEYLKINDIERGTIESLMPLDPDFVFFQEPWEQSKSQSPWGVSSYALPCYIPYSMDWGMPVGTKNFHDMPDFHRLLAYEFIWDESMRITQNKWVRKLVSAGTQIVSGHPTLDWFLKERDHNPDVLRVIYAPHFSLMGDKYPWPFKAGTFEWNGYAILDFAKKHPEIKWYFKPHPGLPLRAVQCGFMTEDEVKDYYREWEKLGASCPPGDYYPLFQSSFAMITDCGSFLLEYLATGKPLIRLISKSLNVFPPRKIQAVFDQFYNVHNQDELFDALDRYIVNREDPNKETRQSASMALGILGHDASEAICNFLKKEFAR